MMYPLWILASLLAIESHASVDFDSQVLPILTHSGCNSGACHGAAVGRGGLHLSLFGSDPKSDHDAIVNYAKGRRVNLSDASKSLFLAKPLGLHDHGGGTVLDEGTQSFSLLKRWLEEGAKRGAKRTLAELRVEPSEAVVVEQGQSIQVKAIAKFSDGEEVDVTNWTVFRSEDSDSIKVLSDPTRLQCNRRGKHTVIARFWNRVVPVTILLPFQSQPIANQKSLEHRIATTNHWIDNEIDSQLQRLNLTTTSSTEDSLFLRRLQLDLIGRLPTPEELVSFRRSSLPQKREKKIDELLDSPEFSTFWTLRLARWLKLRGSPNENQATQAYGQWIRNSLESKRPYDEMVRELLSVTGDSHAIGATNFTRTAVDARQHAELVSSIFLGTRIQCANCHNHPFAQWTQDDYHGLAAVFARFDRGRIVSLKDRGAVTNIRTGEPAIPRIPGVRDLDDSKVPLQEFTTWLLANDNPYFAKATVNRLWEALMGRGLVSGVDDFRETNPPTHPQLLDNLANDFIINGYDLRHTLRTIATSEAYARQCGTVVSTVIKTSETLPTAIQKSTLEEWYGACNSKPLLPEVQLDAIDDVLMLREVEPSQRSARAIAVLDPSQPSSELDALGRCSRMENCQAEGQTTALASKLHAINGDLLNRRITDPKGRLHVYFQQGKKPLEIIEDFYVRALAIQPNAEQRTLWLAELAPLDQDQQLQWLEDFVWAIVSSKDFLTNR